VATLAKLIVSIGANSSEFTTEIKKVQSQLKAFQKSTKDLDAVMNPIVAADEPGNKSSAPACPASLTEPQKTVYRTVVRELSANPDYLQLADRATLMAFAVHTSNFRIAQRHVDVDGAVISGKEGPKVSPWALLAQKESSLALAFSDRLGLSPSSRQTLHVEPPRPSGPDFLTPPPPSRPPHVTLERTISMTETVVQEVEAPGLFDPPDPVVSLVIEPVVVTPPAAELDPTGAQPEDVQGQGEAVVETPVKKKTVDWPFPRFDR
jgi:P27 family predicted phage terminase small subunit